MIIKDLEHLISITDQTIVDNSSILGGSFPTFILPSIELVSLVQASAVPAQLDLGFLGNVNAGQNSILKVFSGVFVWGHSPL